ncbi:MAG TPA: AEC family transporter, partial [Desulfitobacteriaceae bacterium]|nr:AEC family transporter [Desulfitobacteriaceae bacterium]
MEFAKIINQMGVLFLIIIIGYIAAKLKIIDDLACQRFSKFVINLTAPALIITSVSGDYVLGDIKDMLTTLFLSFGFYIIIPILAVPLVNILKVPREDKNLYRFMLIFNNIVFMGFPVVRSIYGEGAIFYASIFNFPNTLFLFSLGIYLVKTQKDSKNLFEVKKLMNSGLFSIILAMFLFVFKIDLPGFLGSTLQMVGSITTPLSLIVIGASIAGMPLKEVFNEKTLYPVAIISLFGIPLFILLILRL